MRASPALAAAVWLAAAGCGLISGEPSPAVLAYGEPDPNPVRYTFSDSAFFTVEAPGYGVMEVVSGRHGTTVLHFRDAAEGYGVRVRFAELEGGTGNPAQGATRVDENDVGGAVGVELSLRGSLVVVDTPAVSPALRQAIGIESLVRPFFVTLPGRPVTVGSTWVDTVWTREEVAGARWRGRRIVASTLLGDTLLDDRRLLRIGVEAVTGMTMAGMSGGVEVEQRLGGTLHGRVLWDNEADMLVHMVEGGELFGTLEMPGTGVEPMPVSATVERRVVLER